MPIYEYLCQECRTRNAILVLNVRQATAVACRHCGSAKLDRVLSRFAAPKSEEARLEALADPSRLGDIDEEDPQSVARLMKKMGKEMGEDVGDMDELLESAGDEETALDEGEDS